MTRIEDLERKKILLEELIKEYSGKTIDNVLFNINATLNYIKKHGSNG